MSKNRQKKKSKNKYIIIIVILIVIIVLLSAALVLNMNKLKKDKHSTSSTVSVQNSSESAVSSESRPSAENSAASSVTSNKNSGWKKEYLKYIDTCSEKGFSEFKLVYINGDSIPELYACGACEADGEYLCSYYDGKLVEKAYPRLHGLSYVETSGLVYCSNSHMGFSYTEVDSLEAGQFKVLNSATAEESCSDGGEKEKHYTVNDRTVTEAEYNEALGHWYDGKKLTEISENLKTCDEIKEQIKNIK